MPRRKRLNFQQQLVGIFERFFDGHQELHGRTTIDDPVIIRKRQIHHRSGNDFAVFNDRSLLDGMHTQNRTLRGI